MARIPEAEIERLKEEVSVERLVEASGIELKKSGKDKLGRCPFHEDDTASLVVSPSKNLWHCFVWRTSLPSYFLPNYRRTISARFCRVFHSPVISFSDHGRA